MFAVVKRMTPTQAREACHTTNVSVSRITSAEVQPYQSQFEDDLVLVEW